MKKVILKIDGMACGMCEAHMNDCIRANFPVKKVTSSYKKGETVLLTEELPNEEALRKVIASTGYGLLSMTVTEPEPHHVLHLFSKK